MFSKSLQLSFFLVYWSYHEANRFKRVVASPVVGPEDPVLVLAAIDSSAVPDPVQIGLTTRIVPPAALMEVSTVT